MDDMTAPPAGALEACPFCGHVPQDLRDAFHPSGIRWREDHGQRHYIGAKDSRDGTPCWELNCLEHEGGCGASMSGDGREEVLAKWNRRTHGPALLAALRDVEKLRVRVRLADHAVSRWVPCPDHRDKTERGICYVCENERLKLAALRLREGCEARVEAWRDVGNSEFDNPRSESTNERGRGRLLCADDLARVLEEGE